MSYSGKIFFFIGRAAKKMEELPELDKRDYLIQEGSRPIGENSPNPKLREAVEKAAQTCLEKGLTESI